MSYLEWWASWSLQIWKRLPENSVLAPRGQYLICLLSHFHLLFKLKGAWCICTVANVWIWRAFLNSCVWSCFLLVLPPSCPLPRKCPPHHIRTGPLAYTCHGPWTSEMDCTANIVSILWDLLVSVSVSVLICYITGSRTQYQYCFFKSQFKSQCEFESKSYCFM